ncbi:hypothetical protein F5887DRAFT_1208074 [Amanita rubescens]|nr:hypothetical protein F5887DRAFT_1208074 [Amanita rubescens]
MDVDLPSSSSKRPAEFPPASSSADKRAKILLPDIQLATLSSNINRKSDFRMWEFQVDKAETATDDSRWRSILSDILQVLTLELASTSMKDSVIANLTLQHADDIVKIFTENQLEEWKVGVRNGVKRGDWSDLLARPELKIPASTIELSPQQEKATKDSWERPYDGQAAEALWTHIRNHFDPDSKSVYAHFCSIVQSSGMGKSRTVDELGKKHFSIPINLRDALSTGYPPADHEVRDFLTTKDTETRSYRRACCFVDALFQHTDYTLKMEFNSQWGIEEVAREFRIRMTAGQTMKVHNEFRREFYRQVIRIATETLRAGDVCLSLPRRLKVSHKVPHPGSDTGPGYASPQTSEDALDYSFFPAASCHKLVESLKAHSSSSPVKEKATEDDYPLVILAFDEAHTLTNRNETGYATWSNLSVLRHVFRALDHFPLFALFLSTTGKISQFISPGDDTSKRIILGELTLIQPFTDLGFDTLAKQVALDGNWDLERVTADSHIVYMGRPLFGSRYYAGDSSVREDILTFAVGKLLNAKPNTQNFTDDQMLACLSQRLPIQFNSTTYISQTAERKQVEGHMRVCLKIDAAFQSMETVSSSEPLLSEAAYVIMARESFDPLKSFKSVLEGFPIHKGDRGEFLVLLLLTLARDQAVGPPVGKGVHPKCRFFNFASFVYGYLFSESPSASGLEKLRHDFPDAKMHFNHFIKLLDFKSVDKKCLLLLMTRGAAVQCTDNHPSINAVTVFLKSGTKLAIDNLGLILYRVSNDPHYTHIPKPKCFESMNPYDVGILKEGDAPVPVIRIIFALAAQTPSLHVTRHDPSPAYNAVVYDIWSAGLSSDFLGPIDPQTTDIWDGLLQASYGWKDIYKVATNVEKELRRSMNPGAANDGGHWSRWAAVRGAKRL